MPFVLNEAVVHSLFDAAAEGEWSAFISAIDENVHWVVCDAVEHPTSLAGTYNLAQWKEKVAGPLFAKLEPAVQKMTVESFDIVGLKLILESKGSATQKNGRPYCNNFAWFLIFDGETGKIVKIREYMNSALTKEVMESNP